MDIESEIERLALLVVSEGGPPGLVVSGMVDGRSVGSAVGVRQAGSGQKISLDTRFPLACVIKPLVNLICLELHVRGAIDIYQPIQNYLPELGPSDPETPTTPAHLAAHMAGYQEPQQADVRWKMDWPRFAELFRERRQFFKPGDVWGYSQTSPAILGRLVHRVTGKEPSEIIRDDLLAPIGVELRKDFQMTGENVAVAHIYTKFRYVPIRLPPESQLLRDSISECTVSMRDLISIGRLIGGGTRPSYISAEAYRLFATTVHELPVASGGGLREFAPTAYGLGRANYGRLIGQAGTYVGITTALRYDPISGTTFALGLNGWAPGLRDQLLALLFRAVTGDDNFLSPTRCQVRRPLSDWAGCYQGLMIGAGEAELIWEDEKLRCSFKMPDGSITEGRFATDDQGFLTGTVTKPWMSIALSTDSSGRPYARLGLVTYALL